MPHGYVMFYDSSRSVLLQKKAYFQHFSVQRDYVGKQPVCGNPGQYSLPGGGLNRVILENDGPLQATLKQFNEESGVTLDILQTLNFSDQGCYSDFDDTDHNGNMFSVHYVLVDDVSMIATRANAVLSEVGSILDDDTMTDDERDDQLMSLYQCTGLNDDAAACYDVVPLDRCLSCLTNTIPFNTALKAEWVKLIRDQCLFWEVMREDKITSILSDPGGEREWYVRGVECFLRSVNGE